MSQEDEFVATARQAAEDIIAPPLMIRRGAALLYQVTVDNTLNLTVDPRHPKRGHSAFETDLAIFEQIVDDVYVPRVVLEFKKSLTTHDVLTYTTKARKHKQVYPYLRYGLIIGSLKSIPGRFFTHNESLDFCVAASEYKRGRLHQLFEKLIREEIKASRLMDDITSGRQQPSLFRSALVSETDSGRVT